MEEGTNQEERCKANETHMISPSLMRVCTSAQLLWSLVVTAPRLLAAYLCTSGGIVAASLEFPEAPGPIYPARPALPRTSGLLPRRRVDMCRPPTPPNILKINQHRFFNKAPGILKNFHRVFLLLFFFSNSFEGTKSPNKNADKRKIWTEEKNCMNIRITFCQRGN